MTPPDNGRPPRRPDFASILPGIQFAAVFNVGDGQYLLTLCTYESQPRFTSSALVNGVLYRFRQCGRQTGVAIAAYCFMPKYVQMLVTGARAHADASRFLTRSKQSSGYWYSTTYGGRLWERDGWERALRPEEEIWDVIRHTLADPVRAGLVRHPLEHPFSGSDVYTPEELAGAFDLAETAHRG